MVVFAYWGLSWGHLWWVVLSSQKPMIVIAGGAAKADGAAGPILSPREGDKDWPEVQGAVPGHHQAVGAGAG